MKKNHFSQSTNGFTLLETIVVIAISTVLLLGIFSLYLDAFNTNNVLTSNLTEQAKVRFAFNSMLASIRSAVPSSAGDYTIAIASSTVFSYYSDIDNDGVAEKIRYFLNGKTLKMGLTEPSGTPLVYNSANEKITTVLDDVVNPISSPIFYYYDDSYSGTTPPLAAPLNISNIRLIKIDLLIDHDPTKSPTALEFTTQATIRNLKDNL